MNNNQKIKEQEQAIARLEKNLSLERLKKRRADTRRKIELGGLVIKSALDGYNKSVILGALSHAMDLIRKDDSYMTLFESIGNMAFLEKNL